MNDEQKDIWERFKRWHLDDIDKCLAIQANYAATKTMLSFIDALGAFYGGLIEHRGKSYVLPGGNRKHIGKTKQMNSKIYEQTSTKKQFLNFVKNYMTEFFKYKVVSGNKQIRLSDILYDHFRCGMIHEGHPKYGTGIIRENSRVIAYENYGGVRVALNILTLRDMLRNAVFSYEKDLADQDQKERMIRWLERYNYLGQQKL